jgi:glycosyltransferase involved in cell wall biosynthesis
MNQLVSIIVPVYNVQDYLEACIQSIIAQNYTDWELILVDDGSTDNSRYICQEYASRDKRIKVATQTNAGPSTARNRGIALSAGKLICFVDSDDTVKPKYLSDMLQKDADLVISGRINVYSDGREDYDAIDMSKADLCLGKRLAYLDFGCFCHGPYAKLFRADIIKQNSIRFPENLDYGEDLIFNLEYICHIKSMALVEACNYYYNHRNVMSLTNRVKPCTTMMKYVVYAYEARQKMMQSFNFASDDYLWVIRHEASFYFWKAIYLAVIQLKFRACLDFYLESSGKINRSYLFCNYVALPIRYRITRYLFKHLSPYWAIRFAQLIFSKK